MSNRKRQRLAPKKVSAPGVGVMRDVVQSFGKLHQKIDEFINDGIEEAPLPISCAEGCDACCRQIISISVPEAIYILSEYGRDLIRANILNKLWKNVVQQVVLLQSGKPLTDVNESGEKCVFLIDGRCRIYAWRPYVCRARTSFDDPNQCLIPDAQIQQLDVSELREKVQKVSHAVGNELRLPVQVMPLPLALTFAHVGFKDGLYKLRDSLKALRG